MFELPNWTADFWQDVYRKFSVYCVCNVNERCVCYMKVYDSMWRYWLFHMRLLWWKSIIIIPFNFKYEYSRVPAIQPLVIQCSILSNISCLSEHCFTFISVHFTFVLSSVNSEWYKLYSPSCLCILSILIACVYVYMWFIV